VWDGVGAPQPAAPLQVDEDGLEAGPVSVEEELAALAVVELRASETVPENGGRRRGRSIRSRDSGQVE